MDDPPRPGDLYEFTAEVGVWSVPEPWLDWKSSVTHGQTTVVGSVALILLDPYRVEFTSAENGDEFTYDVVEMLYGGTRVYLYSNANGKHYTTFVRRKNAVR